MSVAGAPTSTAHVDGLTPPRHGGRSAGRIGEVAVELGFASPDAVERAVASARATGRTTGRVLVDSGVLEADQLARVLAERFGLHHVDLGVYPVDLGAANLIGADAARRYGAVPVGRLDERTLLVAIADPANVLVLDDIGMMTGLETAAALAPQGDIDLLISRLNRLDAAIEEATEETEPEPPEEVLAGEDAADEAPVIKLVRSILAQAIEQGASDIHFAPENGELHGHFRIDGMLVPSVVVPHRMVSGVVARVKIMADLDISERRVPQDGRLGLTVEGRSVDVRVVTLPLVGGESVVMRILDRRTAAITLDELGMLDRERERFERACARAHRALLVTGPTGSGKSTTLYGALSLTNTGERSIITIEDPVEYRVAGVKQMQVNAKAGVTFANGLRSMMRADPDVVMVGEIRDRETAQIAVEAALTGHLVLSTLHTNDAPSAVTRLVEMGIEPFLVASAIDCVVAQRLARRLCPSCKRETVIPAELLRASGFEVDNDLEAWEPVGCGRCGGSGYKGRIGLFEVMAVTEEVRSLALARRPADEIAAVAMEQGMRRLRDDGVRKIGLGVTSVAEVTRVCGS